MFWIHRSTFAVFVSAFAIIILALSSQNNAAIIFVPSPITIPTFHSTVTNKTEPGSKFATAMRKESLTVQFHKQDVRTGTYHFGYDIVNPAGQSYREETRHSSGKVTGKYGFMDPEGILHRFEYEADSEGYRQNQLESIYPEITTIEEGSTSSTSTTTTTTPKTRSPFSQRQDVPVIGPIPKTWNDLFKVKVEAPTAVPNVSLESLMSHTSDEE